MTEVDPPYTNPPTEPAVPEAVDPPSIPGQRTVGPSSPGLLSFHDGQSVPPGDPLPRRPEPPDGRPPQILLPGVRRLVRPGTGPMVQLAASMEQGRRLIKMLTAIVKLDTKIMKRIEWSAPENRCPMCHGLEPWHGKECELGMRLHAPEGTLAAEPSTDE